MTTAAFPIRVMLLADHGVVRWGLEQLLGKEHPRMEVVAQAESVPDALRLLAMAAADVIVAKLDHGREIATDAIDALAKASGGKVLLLSWIDEPGELDRAILAGASGVILKDCDPASIPVAVEKVHMGELWLDRAATSRVFVELSRRASGAKPAGAGGKPSSLTPKERQIVSELAKDARATTRSVAGKLSISEHTLRNHLVSIYGKLGVSSRLELFDHANRHGLARR